MLLNSREGPEAAVVNQKLQLIAKSSEAGDDEEWSKQLLTTEFLRGDFLSFLRNFAAVEDSCRLLERELTDVVLKKESTLLFQAFQDPRSSAAGEQLKASALLADAILKINRLDQHMTRSRTDAEKFHDAHVKLSD